VANNSLLALANFIVDIERVDRVPDVEPPKVPQSGKADDRVNGQAESASTIAVASG
jgi:hypothetical protein